MTLIVETGAGLSTANAFATVAEADTLMGNRLHTATWDAADAEQKATALIWASTILTDRVDWSGSRTTTGQALSWPRMGLYDSEGDEVLSTTIPATLKLATVELAAALLVNDRLGATDDGSVESVSLGDASVSYGSATSRRSVLPTAIWALLVRWLAPRRMVRA